MLGEKLNNLPSSPGVYLMKDGDGEIIYIGKAVNLKSRVRSYFSSGHVSPRIESMVGKIRDFEYILTDSEIEALILESNMIKRHKPKYNVRLTDDKHYPFLKVTVQEDYPRLEIVRSVKKDGARYFGPYTNASAVHETLKLLKKLFPVRSCKQSVLSKRDKPCLNAHINRCAAPCCGLITKEDYRKIIEEAILFLQGKQGFLMKKLQAEMEVAAEKLDFEKAAQIRDQLLAVEKVVAKQKIISERMQDLDVINYAREEDKTCVGIFFIRSGRVLGRDRFIMNGAGGASGGEVLTAFLKQYYSQVDYVPPEILVPEAIEDEETLQKWLAEKRGFAVHLKIPHRGDKRGLLELVGTNAQELLRLEVSARREKEERSKRALQEIAQALKMDKEPYRLECYDISHIQGAETVASMVVFEGGKPVPALYRRFKIKTVEGPDDFASMAEVIGRRLDRAAAGDEKFLPLPDLMVIDGGKGQLSAARAVMRAKGQADIFTVGLAKENEWLFVEGRPEPIVLQRDSRGLQLLQHIRDEAHRYAVTYHRLLRGRRNLASVLDEIPGVGPNRKKALLAQFGLSLQKISGASWEELAETKGIDKKTAQQVWEYFHPR